jgi:hypothetical protein
MAREEGWADGGGERPPARVVVETATLRVRVSGSGFTGAPLSCGPRNEGGGCAGGLAAAVVRPARRARWRASTIGWAGQDGRWVDDRRRGREMHSG